MMDVYNLAFEWTETNRHWLIEVPIRIVAYILVVLIARFLLHRMIDRAATGRHNKTHDDAAGKKPPLLRGLRDRAPPTPAPPNVGSSVLRPSPPC